MGRSRRLCGGVSKDVLQALATSIVGQSQLRVESGVDYRKSIPPGTSASLSQRSTVNSQLVGRATLNAPMLPQNDSDFLKTREWRNRFGRRTVPLVLFGWLAFCIWLFVQVPLLANPMHVVDRLRRSDIAPGTIEMMASMLPVLMCVVAFLGLALLLVLWASVRLEWRYLEMLRRAESRAGCAVTARRSAEDPRTTR